MRLLNVIGTLGIVAALVALAAMERGCEAGLLFVLERILWIILAAYVVGITWRVGATVDLLKGSEEKLSEIRDAIREQLRQ